MWVSFDSSALSKEYLVCKIWSKGETNRTGLIGYRTWSDTVWSCPVGDPELKGQYYSIGFFSLFFLGNFDHYNRVSFRARSRKGYHCCHGYVVGQFFCRYKSPLDVYWFVNNTPFPVLHMFSSYIQPDVMRS